MKNIYLLAALFTLLTLVSCSRKTTESVSSASSLECSAELSVLAAVRSEAVAIRSLSIDNPRIEITKSDSGGNRKTVISGDRLKLYGSYVRTDTAMVELSSADSISFSANEIKDCTSRTANRSPMLFYIILAVSALAFIRLSFRGSGSRR